MSEPNHFTILPAVDLKDGCAVRLRQGRADDQTVYDRDPVVAAKRWADEGAEYLHVVDLDGAFQGAPVHVELIGRMVQACGLPTEIGGGIRTDEDIRRLLDVGVDRVILGTRACAHPEELAGLVQTFGAHLAVGIDARDGRVQVKGWVETTDVTATELARQVYEAGVQTVIYTDTARDGMLDGVHAAAMDAMCSDFGGQVIASGGVSSLEDVKKLKGLKRENLVGAIVGKALYEETVTLKDLMLA